jgi:hypothetical protein
MAARFTTTPLVRWRLILGESSEGAFAAGGFGIGGAGGEAAAADAALSWLYDREHSGDERDIRERGQGGGASGRMTVPHWLNEVHTLFPQETIERLEKDAVERYQIHDVVTNPEVLARVEPNETLLQAVLRTKHLMNPEVLAMARALVAKVVKKLMEKLAKEVKRSFSGARDRRRRSRIKIAKNLDVRETIRANLRRWNPKEKRLYITRPIFFSRSKKNALRWQVILLVDQSGSMLSSAIHSAVTASCLWGLPSVKTHLIAWDSNFVDLTNHVGDPVETLMKVNLGGGNDAAKALTYARQLIEAPRRTIVALITDFYEGAGAQAMVHHVKELVEQGTIVLGLAALDDRAIPAYDKGVAQECANVGAHVGAMTPGELVAFIAEKVRA